MSRKQKNLRLHTAAIEALESDATQRGISDSETLEAILGAYYNLPELIADPKAIQRALAVLRQAGIVVPQPDKHTAATGD